MSKDKIKSTTEDTSPKILEGSISPDSVHNGYVTVTVEAEIVEGPTLFHKTLIKKTGEEEFEQVSPETGWNRISGKSGTISQAYNHPYFNIGVNEIKVVVSDGNAEVEWVGKAILTNRDPYITATINPIMTTGVIGDEDSDDVSYRVSVDGRVVQEWSVFMPTPAEIQYNFTDSDMPVGREVEVTIDVRDTHGGEYSETFTETGDYRGLLFTDEFGEVYTAEDGTILQDLIYEDILVAGNTSEIKKVYLENRQGHTVDDIRVEGARYEDGDGTLYRKAYSFGVGEYGQLGHGGTSNYTTPKLIESLVGEGVAQVSAGHNHTLILTDSGRVYSFGYGGYGRLGHGDTYSTYTPKIIEALVRENIIKIAGGGYHSLVLTDKGEVYSFGAGGAGRLGHGDTSTYHTPEKVEALIGKSVTQVSAGYRHSLVLTDKGEAYSFGEGDYGKLGHGNSTDYYTPRLIKALEGKRVVQVSAGHNHSIVLTDKGEAYSFGEGDYGKLGHGNSTNYYTPRLIKALEGKRIVQATAGFNHSLVLTDKGEVYSFGHGGYGRLGHGDTSNHSTPMKIEELVGERVVQTTVGEYHSVVSTDKGEVYSFGRGSRGRLGHVSTSNQYTPKKLETLVGERVVAIDTGNSHTVAITSRGSYIHTNEIFPYSYIEFSETEQPFVPKSILEMDPLEPLEKRPLYVRVNTTEDAHMGGKFFVTGMASPKKKDGDGGVDDE